ncbi:hypothetical protein [Paraburkholderia phenazinium]|jgi:hypothetical protein|uniref:Uncharacterized protein n=1 Tax=Paraburkholderia phenazinium TaxID=60549 RepID=A0A1G7SD58_9BURK|nr:hypothetical protein [Paraburkholderia phenazinium]SDG21015.1 hypothetical protein SAMN05216466_102478 [Paraburkholderia phenazinium]
MIDDQVSAEELAESKKQREAAETATDDGMPVAPTPAAPTPAAPKSNTRGVGAIQYKTLKQWVKHSTKWLGSGATPTHQAH